MLRSGLSKLKKAGRSYFTYFWLLWVVIAVLRLALVVGLVGHTPVAVCVLLIVADSLVEKYGV